MDTLLLGLLALLFVVIAIVLFRKPQGATDLVTPLQNLTQAVQQAHTQVAVLGEKMTRLESLPQAVSQVQVEMRGLAERVSTVEGNQQRAAQDLATLGTGLTHTSTVAQSIVETTAAIRDELSRAKNDLTALHAHSKARQDLEQRTAESIRRLETIIAGTQSKGAAGENILEVVFAKLPPDWQVRNFRVGNKAVEFGLRLPNNLVVPIDSKWAATHLLERFLACEDLGEQRRLRGQIETAVLEKAREVKKYLDPNITVNFGIAAVPDAIYDLCTGIQADVFQLNVVLVSYSMFVPYLLLVFQTVLKTSQHLDLHKLEAYVDNAQRSLAALQEELEGRLSKAITMLHNARDDMSLHLSKVNSGLASLRIGAEMPVTEAVVELATK